MATNSNGVTEAEESTRARRPRRASASRKRAPAARKAPTRRPRRAAPRANTTLLEDVGAMAGQVGEYTWDASQRASRMMRDGSRTARRALADVEHGFEGALSVGGRYGDMLAARFRERPLATVAGIGAMAMIVGWLFGGRR